MGGVAVHANQSRSYLSVLFDPRALVSVMCPSMTYNRDRESPLFGGNLDRCKSGMGRGWGQGWFLCQRRVRVVRGGMPVSINSPLVEKRYALGCMV